MRRARRSWFLISAVLGAIAAATAFVAIPAHAAAVVQIKGELYSLTESECQIRTEQNVYHIRRDALSKHAREALGKAGKSSRLTLAVPLQAIEKVVRLERK